jgi:hypothetical protein
VSEQAHEPFPEHAKLKALGDRKDEIQSFIDWLYDEQDSTIAAYASERHSAALRLDSESHRLFPIGSISDHPIHTESSRGKGTREKIMAAYFGIDLRKIDEEKDEMLAALRAMNA